MYFRTRPSTMNCSYCQRQKTDLLLLQLSNMIEDAPPQLRINRARGLQANDLLDLLQIQSLPLYKPQMIFQTQLLFSRNQLLFNKSLSCSTTTTSFPQSKLNLRSHIGLNRKHWLKEVIWVGWNFCQPNHTTW